MTGVKSFVLGFSLSLFSVSLCGQLFHSTPVKKETLLSPSVKINLFKNNDISSYSSSDSFIFANIAKKSLAVIADNSMETNILSPEGIEDDEILNLSTDDNIPIEYDVSSMDTENTAEVLDNIDTEEKTAMLPTDLRHEDNFLDSPWIVARGAPSIKNKKLAQDLGKISNKTLFTDDFQKTVNNDKAISYKVAEKIKQSIIFPIPDEILNDENLTPTFIKGKTNEKPLFTSSTKTQKSTKKVSSSVEDNAVLDIIDNPKVKTDDSDKGFFGSISSWFSDKPSVEDKVSPARKKATPSYGSQDNTNTPTLSKSSEDLASFYESLQNTQREYSQRKIIPSELRLFFQPGRAEISGSTLRWLKTFSDAAQDDDTFLQINLDASASTELQKKRLDLLYTILMNNGVDFRKVDTNFSLSEPNAFVIRTIKNR